MKKIKVRVYAEYYKEYEFERGTLDLEQIFQKAEDMFLSEKRNDFKGLQYSNKGVSNIVIGLKSESE